MSDYYLGNFNLIDQDFFVPREHFLTWMTENYAHRQIVEVGAGRGLFSHKLLEKKLKVVAFDLNERDNSFKHVLTGVCATSYPYHPNDIVIVARPCHGHFVDDLLDRVFDRSVPFVYYIGLEKNIELDIDPDLYEYETIATNIGEDEECLIKVKPR